MNESSITRIMRHLRNYDCATITAFREMVKDTTDGTLPNVLEYEGKEIPMSTKKAWNRDLKAALLKLGYGVTKIKGRYKEDGWDSASDEESYFVVNLTDDPEFIGNISALGEGYNQDSVMIKEKGSDNAYLLGTNGADWPGFDQTFDIGKLEVNVPLDYIGASSIIKNKAFAFKTDESAQPICFETFLDHQSNSKALIAKCARGVLESLGISSTRPFSVYQNAFRNAIIK